MRAPRVTGDPAREEDYASWLSPILEVIWSNCFFFFFLYSMDLRATSSLVLRRTGSIRLPLGVIRFCRVSRPCGVID